MKFFTNTHTPILFRISRENKGFPVQVVAQIDVISCRRGYLIFCTPLKENPRKVLQTPRPPILFRICKAAVGKHKAQLQLNVIGEIFKNRVRSTQLRFPRTGFPHSSFRAGHGDRPRTSRSRMTAAGLWRRHLESLYLGRRHLERLRLGDVFWKACILVDVLGN